MDQLWMDALMCEQRAFDKGYQEGLKKGENSGLHKGYSLGYKCGLTLHRQVHFYAGQAEALQILLAQPHGPFSATISNSSKQRCDTLLREVIQMCSERFPTNNQDKTISFDELFSKLVGKFRLILALLKLPPSEFSPASASSDSKPAVSSNDTRDPSTQDHSNLMAKAVDF